MIRLTRLNDSEVFVNALLIEQIESTPDTVVTLTNGRRLVVRESPAEICQRGVEYLGTLHRAAGVEEGRGVTPGQWGRLAR
ncbi:MAG TPA: flagellar FlbD family protein [Armatimonadota bacterium]|jgi:flagellar protein FlbD